MGKFLDHLIVWKVDARHWRLVEAFRYRTSKHDLIGVPAGFITDFASIPRAFWWLAPPDGKYTAPAVVHDYLYYSQTRPRKECDLIFLEAMATKKVPLWKRQPMYRAVRLFGWIGWNKRSEQIKKKPSN